MISIPRIHTTTFNVIVVYGCQKISVPSPTVGNLCGVITLLTDYISYFQRTFLWEWRDSNPLTRRTRLFLWKESNFQKLPIIGKSFSVDYTVLQSGATRHRCRTPSFNIINITNFSQLHKHFFKNFNKHINDY